LGGYEQTNENWLKFQINFRQKKITLGDTQDEIYLFSFHWNEN
jgi:hypothetical protein